MRHDQFAIGCKNVHDGPMSMSHDACERAAFDGPDKGGNGQRTRYADQPSTRTGNTHDVVIGNMIRTTECEPQNEKFTLTAEHERKFPEGVHLRLGANVEISVPTVRSSRSRVGQTGKKGKGARGPSRTAPGRPPPETRTRTST